MIGINKIRPLFFIFIQFLLQPQCNLFGCYNDRKVKSIGQQSSLDDFIHDTATEQQLHLSKF